jgi:hypothetical protein
VPTASSGRRRRLPLLIATAASALTLAGALTPGIAQASMPLGHAVQIRPPLHAMPVSLLFGVGCAPSGPCTAGGVYADGAGHSQAMVVTESGRHWPRATKLRLPKGAPASPIAEANSVSCAAAGSCVAGGSYFAGGHNQGFVASMSRGRWGRARGLTLPHNSAASSDYRVVSLACTRPGSCVAIGDYQDIIGDTLGFAATESGGSWHRAIKLRMPLNASANPAVAVSSVSCGRTGFCMAGGRYFDNTGAFQAVAVTESAGTWQLGTEITLPSGAAAGPQADINAVACPSAGTCLAVGRYFDSLNNLTAFTVTYSAGTWQHAVRFTRVPPNAAAHPAVQLNGVSCPRAGTCVAVGSYTDRAGGAAPFAVFRHSGKWLAGVQVSPPGNARAGGIMNASLLAVSCTRRGFCAAAGFYFTKASNEAAMAATTPSM